MTGTEQFCEQIMQRMDLTKETEDEELREIIRDVLEEACRREYIPLSEKIRISRELFNAFRKLDILQDLIEDDTITEIMVNGTENIFYEREGRIVRSERRFLSESRLADVIQQIVGETNRYVNESSPIVDARLKDGSRVNVVLKPAAVNGPILTIRKFPKNAVTMEQLIRLGSLTEEAAAFLKMLVRAKYNIFISGGTGAGKTTFLNALSDYIPKEERIITIEDNAELQIRGVENLVRLEARDANLEGEGAVTIRDLIRSALRMRPDRIVVGEVREAESFDLLIALNSGVPGLCTIHANSAREAVTKLCTLPLLAGENVTHHFVVPTVASAVDLVVHLGVTPDGTRQVREIVAVTGRIEEGRVECAGIFHRQPAALGGRLVRGDGFPPGDERFARAGIDVRALLASEVG